MPTAAITSPLLAKNFRVEIDGIAATTTFTEVSGLSAVIDIVDYRTGGSLENAAQKLPGLGSFPNITLKRGFISDISLWTWKLSNALPCRWSGSDLAADSSAVAIETLEICYESLQSTLAT